MEADSANPLIRSLNEKHLVEAYLAFMDAFEHYPVPFSLTLDEFKYKFVTYMRLDYFLSAGLWQGGEIMAFILAREYQNEVYAGALGVRNSGQGKGLFRKLLAERETTYASENLAGIRLEVLKENKRARELYLQCGFQPLRTLYSFKGRPEARDMTIPRSAVSETLQIPWETVLSWFKEAPPFMCSEAVIDPQRTFDRAWIYREEERILGLLVMNPNSGRVSQLLVHPDHQGKGIGRSLLSWAARLTQGPLYFVNVPKESEDVRALLERSGFRMFAEQMEMKKRL